LAIDRVQLEPQITPEHAHQGIDLQTRALPVLGRKCIKSQCTESKPRPGIDGSAHSFDTRAVAGDSRLTALGRPSAVSIHDDCYMAWEALPVERREQHLVARIALYNISKILEHLS
jgi:hypothetical protein